jgi:hypothetical protein
MQHPENAAVMPETGADSPIFAAKFKNKWIWKVVWVKRIQVHKDEDAGMNFKN